MCCQETLYVPRCCSTSPCRIFSQISERRMEFRRRALKRLSGINADKRPGKTKSQFRWRLSLWNKDKHVKHKRPASAPGKGVEPLARGQSSTIGSVYHETARRASTAPRGERFSKNRKFSSLIYYLSDNGVTSWTAVSGRNEHYKNERSENEYLCRQPVLGSYRR